MNKKFKNLSESMPQRQPGEQPDYSGLGSRPFLKIVVILFLFFLLFLLLLVVGYGTIFILNILFP